MLFDLAVWRSTQEAEGTPLERVQVVNSGARVQIPPSPLKNFLDSCKKEKMKSFLKKLLTKKKSCVILTKLSQTTTTENLDNWTVMQSRKFLKRTKRTRLTDEPKNSKRERSRRKTKAIVQTVDRLNMRVWSWLRMNAGGVPNTCKSNGVWIRKSSDGIVWT